TKDESQIAIKSLSEESKTMINECKADINPNIEQIQKNIENISNRGNEIQKEIQNTKLPFLKN
ncbi:YtxH domain-containing protein, partial [Mammaliicoccus sciuri]